MRTGVSFPLLAHPKSRGSDPGGMLTCETVRRSISDHLDGEVSSEMFVLIEQHLQTCRPCTVLFAGVRNVAELAADPRVASVPEGFSSRLEQRILLDARQPSIPLG